MNNQFNVFKSFESISQKDIVCVSNILDMILSLPQEKLLKMTSLECIPLGIYNIEIEINKVRIDIAVSKSNATSFIKDFLMFDGELICKNPETENIYQKVYNLVGRLTKDVPSKFENIALELSELFDIK